MASGKVARRTAVSDVAELLDSPEVAALIEAFAPQGRGRKGFGPRALVGACLVKALFALPTWTRVAALIAEHPGLQAALGGTPKRAARVDARAAASDKDNHAPPIRRSVIFPSRPEVVIRTGFYPGPRCVACCNPMDVGASGETSDKEAQMALFRIVRASGGYRAQFWSGGNLVWWTEVYVRREGAQNAIDTIRWHGSSATQAA